MYNCGGGNITKMEEIQLDGEKKEFEVEMIDGKKHLICDKCGDRIKPAGMPLHYLRCNSTNVNKNPTETNNISNTVKTDKVDDKLSKIEKNQRVIAKYLETKEMENNPGEANDNPGKKSLKGKPVKMLTSKTTRIKEKTKDYFDDHKNTRNIIIALIFVVAGLVGWGIGRKLKDSNVESKSLSSLSSDITNTAKQIESDVKEKISSSKPLGETTISSMEKDLQESIDKMKSYVTKNNPDGFVEVGEPEGIDLRKTDKVGDEFIRTDTLAEAEAKPVKGRLNFIEPNY